jgi:predicted flap endonuclease-1-like 5' DNA nuclease
MLDILNPCNDPNAWWQQLLMLGIPFLLGLLWAKGSTTTDDSGNSDLLASLDADLADCRKSTVIAEATLKASSNISGSATLPNSFSGNSAVSSVGPESIGSAIASNDISKSKKDDLKVVEGIGPKIETLFNDAGIYSFEQLANTTAGRLKEILVAAGSRYQMHDPTTWPAQSKLASEGKWEELKKWQDELNKGNA